MICKNCGKEAEDGKKFCEECGAPLDQTDSNKVSDVKTEDFSEIPQENSTPENTVDITETNQDAPDSNDDSPILNSNSDYSSYSVGGDNSFDTPVAENPPKKKGKKKIVLLVVAIILVALIIFGTVFGVVFTRVYKSMKVMSSTWDDILNADSDTIVEKLPDEYIEKINELYGFEEDDIKEALDMLVGDMIATDFDSSSVKISSVEINTISSSETDQQIVDTVNAVFEDVLADYESEFPEVFAGTYEVVENADKVYSANETLTDGTETNDYVTILYKIDDTTYDAIPTVVTDLCCYYYSIFTSYYSTDVDESSTDAIAE
jgi:hypothetical protein